MLKLTFFGRREETDLPRHSSDHLKSCLCCPQETYVWKTYFSFQRRCVNFQVKAVFSVCPNQSLNNKKISLYCVLKNLFYCIERGLVFVFVTFFSGSHEVFIQSCNDLFSFHNLSFWSLVRMNSNSISFVAFAKARSLPRSFSFWYLLTPFFPLLIHLTQACSRWKSHKYTRHSEEKKKTSYNTLLWVPLLYDSIKCLLM